MIVIRIIFWVGKSSNTSSDYDYIKSREFSTGNSDFFQKTLDSIGGFQDENSVYEAEGSVIEALSYKYKLTDHTKFIYTLKRKVDRKTSDEILGTLINPFTNPYEKTFNELPHTLNHEDNTFLNIINRSKKDLIVFRLTPGIDQSIYIPKGERISIEASQNDSLLFYTGIDFTSTRFSHFKRESDLSNLYKITDYDTTVKKEISIYPFKDIISVVESSSSNKVLRDSLRRETIKTNKVRLQQLNIDKIYTDWYNRKYRN